MKCPQGFKLHDFFLKSFGEHFFIGYLAKNDELSFSRRLLIYEANDQGVIWMAVGGKNVIDRC